MIHIFSSVDGVNTHLEHHNCSRKLHKLESIQVRHQVSLLLLWLCLVSGGDQQSPVFTAVTLHLGARGGNLEICHPKWAQPTWLAIQTVFTTLPKAQTLPIDITSSCKWCQQSLATSQQKNVDASVRDLNVFPGSVWWDSPRSCLVVMRWNWDVECHYTSTVQYSRGESLHPKLHSNLQAF